MRSTETLWDHMINGDAQLHYGLVELDPTILADVPIAPQQGLANPLAVPRLQGRHGIESNI